MTKNNNSIDTIVKVFSSDSHSFFSKIEYIEEEGAYKVLLKDGGIVWTNENGKFHRIKGPAYESGAISKGYSAWYKNGEFHRINGPCLEGLPELTSSLFQGLPGSIESIAYKTDRWCIDGKIYKIKDYWKEMIDRGHCSAKKALMEYLKYEPGE